MTQTMLSTRAADGRKLPRTERLRDQLQSAFGAEFGVWTHSPEGWTRADVRADAQVAVSAALAAWFDDLLAQPPAAPQLAQIDGDHFMAAVVCEEIDLRAVVAGRIELDAQSLARSAAQSAAQQVELQAARDEQQQLVDQYAERLSESFEELTFLRRLSRHVEFCNASRSLADAALSILPQLRNLTGLEELALVIADSSGGEIQAGRMIGWSSSMSVCSEFWRGFIERLGVVNRRTLVRNYRGGLAVADALPIGAVLSVVLTPIEKDGLIYGWLLGVNKRAPATRAAAPANSLGHDEIGSMEASLLEAAALMLGSHAANHRLFQEQETLVADVIHTLVGVIEAKDTYTCGHSDRVALVGRRLGLECGLSAAECQDIFLSGLLHDIGKIGIADDVLLKPDKLSEAEFAQIKQHPETGARLLRGLRPLEKLIDGVLYHHEAVDGSGYPHGLRGDEIPLMARILAVADAFDAMTSDRPYRRGMPVEKAVAILRAGAGKQWDEQVLTAFFAAQADIVEIGCHWQDHLQQLLNFSAERGESCVAVGAVSFSAAFETLTDLVGGVGCTGAQA